MAEPCPRCRAEVTGPRCPQCGLLVALYRASLEKLRRGPVPPLVRRPAPEPVVVSATGSGTMRAEPSERLQFHGSAPDLFGIQIVNALWTLLTLGVYFFWGRTRVRAYLLGGTELGGDRFAYHGNGLELLIGFLKGVVLFGVPVVLLSVLPALYGAPAEVTAALATLIWLTSLVLVPVAMVGARRYRLSRTSWRGVRFSFRGSIRELVGIFAVGTILTSLTLGLYYPVFATRRQAFMVSHSYFGSRPFTFDGRGRELLGPFVTMLLLFVPSLGLSWFWFSARRQRYFTDHTRFGATTFRSVMTGGRLAWLKLSNIVVLVLTLGLAWPWTIVRGLRFTFRYLALEGGLDLGDIRQDRRAATATGEGLAGLLDADFGVS